MSIKGGYKVPTLGNQEVTFDLSDVHSLSLDLLEDVKDADVTGPLAAAAMAMSFARMMAYVQGRVLDVDEEVSFIQGIFEWSSMFLVGGKVH